MSGYLCACPELGEYVRGATIGGSNKYAEIIENSGDVGDIVAMLIADRCSDGEERPADIPASTMAGRWAGRRICWLGDFMSTLGGDDPEGRWNSQVPLDRAYDHAMEKWRDIGREVVDAMLGVHHRMLLKQTYTVRHEDGEISSYDHHVPMQVKLVGGAIVPDVTEDMENDFCRRVYEASADLMANADPDLHFDFARIKDGPRRVMLNIDRREYFDPTLLGEMPTLAGIVRGSSKNVVGISDPGPSRTQPTAIRTLSVLMMDPERWWNDRVILTGQGQEDMPSTEAVEGDADFRDITHRLLMDMPIPDMTIMNKLLAIS